LPSASTTLNTAPNALAIRVRLERAASKACARPPLAASACVQVSTILAPLSIAEASQLVNGIAAFAIVPSASKRWRKASDMTPMFFAADAMSGPKIDWNACEPK
jgi:hypothetical protein